MSVYVFETYALIAVYANQIAQRNSLWYTHHLYKIFQDTKKKNLCLLSIQIFYKHIYIFPFIKIKTRWFFFTHTICIYLTKLHILNLNKLFVGFVFDNNINNQKKVNSLISCLYAFLKGKFLFSCIFSFE